MAREHGRWYWSVIELRNRSLVEPFDVDAHNPDLISSLEEYFNHIAALVELRSLWIRIKSRNAIPFFKVTDNSNHFIRKSIFHARNESYFLCGFPSLLNNGLPPRKYFSF